MRALVTGGAGFVGTNLIKKLLSAGHEVISFDNYSTGFRENEQDDHYVKIQVEGLMRGDSNARANFYKQMIDMGVMSINEVRQLENMNRIEDGDTHYFPMNYAPIGQTIEEDADTNA